MISISEKQTDLLVQFINDGSSVFEHGSAAKICDFAYTNRFGDIKKFYNYNCLGPLFGLSAPKNIKAVAYATRKYSTTHNSKYLEYLFDKEISPWRNVLDHVTVIRTEKGKHIKGFIINGAANSELAFGLLVAARFGYEHEERVKNFLLFYKAGVPVEEALWLCLYFRFSDLKNLGPSSHSAYYTSLVKQISLKKLRDGIPVGNTKTLNDEVKNKCNYLLYEQKTKGFKEFLPQKTVRSKYGIEVLPTLSMKTLHIDLQKARENYYAQFR